jgi:hypothetical protein
MKKIKEALNLYERRNSKDSNNSLEILDHFFYIKDILTLNKYKVALATSIY